MSVYYARAGVRLLLGDAQLLTWPLYRAVRTPSTAGMDGHRDAIDGRDIRGGAPVMYRHYWCLRWYVNNRVDSLVESCATGHFDTTWRGDPGELAESLREAKSEREGIDIGRVLCVNVEMIEYEE